VVHRRERQAEGQAIDSLGVSALAAEAEAKKAQVQGGADDVDAIEKVAQSQLETSAYLSEQARHQAGHAKSMVEQASDLEQQVAEETRSAGQIEQMAKLDIGAATTLEKQADADMAKAEKMMTHVVGATGREISAMAEEQRMEAEAAKERAKGQLASAEKMRGEAGSLKAKALEQPAAAQALNETARQEAEAADATKDQADALTQRSKNTSQIEAKIQSSAGSTETAAAAANELVKSESVDWTKSTKDIATAQAQIERANAQELTQNRRILDLQALRDQATQELRVAQEMMDQLDTQIVAFQNVSGMSAGSEDSSLRGLLSSLMEEQVESADAAKAQAAGQIRHAKALGAKAESAKSAAQQRLAAAKAWAEQAKEMLAAAQAVQGEIDAPGSIMDANVGQIKSMVGTSEEAKMAADTVDEAVKFEREAIKVVREGLSSETSDAKAMRDKTAGFKNQAVLETVASSAAAETASVQWAFASLDVREAGLAQLEAMAGALHHKAEQLQAIAMQHEDAIFQATFDRRICMDLPGVSLNGYGPKDFARLAGEDAPPSAVAGCAAECRKNVGCKESIWSQEAKGCYLFANFTTNVQEFRDDFNSSICGEPEETDAMKAMVDAIYKQKPWILAPVECSWSDEDCSQTQCCNNVKCDWKFECMGYSCYKANDGYSSTCKTSAPAGYLTKAIGGTRQVREIAKAPEGVLVQGTSLFCFSVVMWHTGPTQAFYDSEADLASNWMHKGLGIMQCDDHMIIDGQEAPTSAWGSFSNIDVFINVWGQVQKDGRYLQHDWIVKVDTDAVFFPQRLKTRLSSLRTPQGSLAYLRNNEYKFQFMGALEVMTRQALERYYEHAERCAVGGGGHSGGEDFYMKSCLEGIGVDYQADFQLLTDRYAGQDSCADGWSSCFHFLKKVSGWNECHQQALDAEAASNPMVAFR